jgi:hypothetical protein
MMEERNAPPTAPHTPLVWGWGALLLSACLSLTGFVALLRAFGALFR